MTKALPLGTRYDPKNKELQFTNPSLKCFANFSSQSEREIYETKNAEIITFYILSQIANDIDSMISFSLKNELDKGCSYYIPHYLRQWGKWGICFILPHFFIYIAEGVHRKIV